MPFEMNGFGRASFWTIKSSKKNFKRLYGEFGISLVSFDTFVAMKIAKQAILREKIYGKYGMKFFYRPFMLHTPKPGSH